MRIERLGSPTIYPKDFGRKIEDWERCQNVRDGERCTARSEYQVKDELWRRTCRHFFPDK